MYSSHDAKPLNSQGLGVRLKLLDESQVFKPSVPFFTPKLVLLLNWYTTTSIEKASTPTEPPPAAPPPKIPCARTYQTTPSQLSCHDQCVRSRCTLA